MRILKLDLENFMGYQKASFDLEDKRLVLLEGANHDFAAASSTGSGKSTVSDAMSFGLYGRAMRPLKLDSMVREGASWCRVLIELQLGKQRLKIERYHDHPTHK
ncbi:hypothetical protein LCGC14_1885430, partial [marine sediment metagenome]